MKPERSVQDVLDELRRIAETGSLREDLVEQRRALLEFLGTPKGNFFRLQNSFGGPVELRSELLREIIACRDRIRPLFPNVIQVSLNELTLLAGPWANDWGVQHRNTVEDVDLLLYHWAILEGYSDILREILVKAERNTGASTHGTAQRVRETMERFKTPSGAGWEEVFIRFQDGHTVSIKVREVQGVFHYAQMGMISRKDAKPTVQWELLKQFADGGGTLDWTHRKASHKLKKRRETLAKDLKAFFGIEEDPFEPTPDKKGWTARFSLWAEE